MNKIIIQNDPIGRVYNLDYSQASIYVPEIRKNEVGGIKENDLLILSNSRSSEYVLIRVREVAPPTMDNKANEGRLIETYKKEELKKEKTENENSEGIDLYEKASMSYINYKCKVLGTIFYDDKKGKYLLGSDIYDVLPYFNYSVYKPEKNLLERIIKISGDLERIENGGTKEGKAKNIRVSQSVVDDFYDYSVVEEENNELPKVKEVLERYGVLRFASSKFEKENAPEFFINSSDMLSRRTGLFGMTRTGKSNSIKKIIQTTENIKQNSGRTIGQLIFDVNGEYANDNVQDGTSIADIYKKITKRYSFIEKDNFELMKINFLDEKNGGLQEGLELLRLLLEENSKGADYFQSFLSIDFPEEIEEGDFSTKNRTSKNITIYQSILHRAGFETLNVFVKNPFNKEIKEILSCDSSSISLDLLMQKWIKLWNIYEEHEYFEDYKQKNDKEYLDEEAKALLVVLTGCKTPGSAPTVSGYKKIIPYKMYHSIQSEELFTDTIVRELKKGKIVIVDLSIGSDKVKKVYSDKLTKAVFGNNRDEFIADQEPTNIQLYFEEAHNLFPTGQNADLTNIYNRLAKEGAKYKIGIVYATQEVSSISPNILKNTENFFVSHLNNDFELNYLKQFYDYGDYINGLKRFANGVDVGYSRIKMFSYPFVFPVQIDKFEK